MEYCVDKGPPLPCRAHSILQKYQSLLLPFRLFFFLWSGVFADCSCKCSQFLCQHFALLHLHQHGVHQQACRGDLGRERGGKKRKPVKKKREAFFLCVFLTPDSFSGVSSALMTTLTCDETQVLHSD